MKKKTLTKIIQIKDKRIRQGDIIKNISYVHKFKEERSSIFYDEICFPKVIVLSQDCDLEQEFNNRIDATNRKQHNFLISALLAPAYNAVDVYEGTYLERLRIQTDHINSKQQDYIETNRDPRYHYMEFDRNELNVSPLIIDFKHYFSLNINIIEESKHNKYLGTIAELHRELLSQRFAFFLSRIGIPSQNADYRKEEK